MKRSVRFGLAILAISALCVAACGNDSSKSSSSTTTTTAKPAVKGDVTVSAAASLTDAFTQIGTDFHTANPDATVTFNFGSSGTLAMQIIGGAPAGVFASADTSNMQKVSAAHLVQGKPVDFASNSLIIATKPGNPKVIRSLSDLAKPGLVVSLCSLDAPCGAYAQQILDAAKVTIPASQITRGQDAKATLAAVTQGDADAAIVYVTDAWTVGTQVSTVSIPAAQNVIAKYPIASLTHATSPDVAKAFVQYVTSPQGQARLSQYGFRAP
jgi:molybdate transport system substrate-binding protein